MKLIKLIITFIVFIPCISLAGEDSWYKNQPPCVNAASNITNTNFSDENQKKFEFKHIVWKIPTNSFAPAICYGNTIFFGLNGYDIATGKLVWKLNFPDNYSTEEYIIYKDHMYATIESDGYTFLGVYDINLKTKTADLLPLGIPLNRNTSTKLLAYNDILYMTFSSGDLIAYSLASHNIIWSNKNKLHAAAPLTTDGNSLFTEKRGLVAYDLLTGNTKWHISTSMGTMLGYQNGLLYIDGAEGITAINATTGEVVWNYMPDGLDDETFMPSYLYISKNSLFFIEGQLKDSMIYALDALTGHLKWKRASFKIEYLSNNALYLKNYQNDEITVVNPNSDNFQILTSYHWPYYLIHPSIINDTLFFGDYIDKNRYFIVMK